jgi:hypothetical protein
VEGQSESEPRGFCKIDAEALTAALIAPGHGRTGVAELGLYVAFFDLDRRRHAGAQRMSREFVLPVGFEKIATHARGKRRALDQSGDMLVVETVRTDMFSAGLKAAEQWAVRNAGKFARWNVGLV